MQSAPGAIASVRTGSADRASSKKDERAFHDGECSVALRVLAMLGADTPRHWRPSGRMPPQTEQGGAKKMHEEWRQQGKNVQRPDSGAPGLAGAGPGEDAGGSEWNFLPDGLQGLKEGFEEPETFWAEMSRLAAMARERKAVTGARPDSLVTEEDWQAFWKAAGRPDSPDGYKLPEEWTDERADRRVAALVNQVMSEERETLLQAFHKGNLTGSQAGALYNIICGLMAQNIQDELVSQKDWATVTEELWPGETERHLETARRGARYAGLGKALDEAGLSGNPLVLRLAHALGETVGEAGMPGSAGASEAMPRGDAAREEMYRVIASNAYRTNDPAAIRKVEALARRVDM